VAKEPLIKTSCHPNFLHTYIGYTGIKTTMSNASELAGHYHSLLELVGENPQRDGLKDTPKRAAKAMEYMTQGYHQNLDEVVNGAIFESDNDQMVIIKDVELYSMCEHHLLPFVGKCHIAYLPAGKVIGLSKMARITDMYSRRLQIQENLTEQIADAIEKVTGARGVGVIIEAKHFCMMMRGVEKQNSVMKTSMMLGTFRTDHRTRAEFLTLVGSS
jgi:GTP cyclohydrolase I